MEKIRIMAILCLVLGVAASWALTPPASAVPAASAVARSDEPKTGEGDKKDDADKDEEKDENKKEARDKTGRSYRDKLDARGKKAPAPKPDKKPKYKKWKDVLDDATSQEGLFKVWTKREDVFFELGEEHLDKPYLAVLSLSKGMGTRYVLGGLPISNMMFDFHRVEDHVQVRMLNTLFRAEGDSELEKAIDLSYGNSIVVQLPIESENEKEKKILINMNDLFLSDVADLGYFLQIVLKKAARLDSKKAIYKKIKAYPQNVEIDALLTYSPLDRVGLSLPSVPDSRFIELGVQYSIRTLPEEPMKPRLADDRMGYFLTVHKDFTKEDQENFFVHYVNRWRLEKKDPDADVSEPKEPIVFYVDHTVPKKYVRYVKEGIEMWQKAFEEAGLRNAIIAKDAPTPEEDPEYDPEDARYNTIRWIVSDEPSFGAIGPSRKDPRTGEVLDADILIEQDVLAGFRSSYRRFAGPEAFLTDVDPLLEYLADPQTDPEAARRFELDRVLEQHCGRDFGVGFSHGFEFLQLALLADGLMKPGMSVPEEYIAEAIRFVVCHEVGHTLGLRHNFKSSTSTPLDKLHDRYVTGEIGLTGSIMDYQPPNVSRDRSRQGFYYTPSVGPWDRWAIRWGYSEIPGNKGPEKEAEVLESIAAEATAKEHAYGPDEDTYPAGAMDPLCAIWDLGDDPLAWAKERIGLCQDIFAGGKLEERVVGDGGNFVPLRYAVQTLLMQEYIAMSRAVKYVGGQYTARPHRGAEGGGLPMTPVPAAKQREALQFIIDNAFAPDAFALSPDLMNRLADNRVPDWQNPLWMFGRRIDFPLVAWVGAIHNALLIQLMNPMLLQRVVDAGYKADDSYDLSDLFSGLTQAIWYGNMTPAGRTAVMQRNLQRIYLDKLISMTVKPSGIVPHEAVALARLHLTRLQSRIDQASKQAGLGDEALAHLAESKARIDRALDARLESGY
jgi:hypothetical protein